MQYSEAGLQMTRHFEGCRLEAYQDEAGVWTIGYGHTAGVKEGDTCTQEQADDWVAGEFERASVDVLCLSTVYLSTCQRYALADFVFNLGRGALRGSTLLKKLNAGDYEGAAAEFPKWNKVRVNGVLQVDKGLTRRRLAEQKMFEGRDWR